METLHPESDLLNLTNISKSFKKSGGEEHLVLDSVSLTIKEG